MIERSTGNDRATRLVESILGDSNSLHQLLVGRDKNTMLMEVAAEVATFDVVETAGLLRILFQDLAREGDVGITNRRDGALALLQGIATPEIFERDRLDKLQLYTMYLAAVRQQGAYNDPYGGSIYALLEAGKVLAPYLSVDRAEVQKIIYAWEEVIEQFTTLDYRIQIRLEIDQITDRASPNRLLDTQVEELRNQGLSNADIADHLGLDPTVIRDSAHRLIIAGRIELGKRGKKPKV